MGEKSQRAAASGRIDRTLQHFHNSYRDALGLSPLEEYCAYERLSGRRQVTGSAPAHWPLVRLETLKIRLIAALLIVGCSVRVRDLTTVVVPAVRSMFT